jgi:hypothetical protein
MTKLLVLLLVITSGMLIPRGKDATKPVARSGRAPIPILNEERFDYSPANDSPYKQDVVMSYWLRCYRGAIPVISAIVQNGADGSRKARRKSLPWSTSANVQISVFDFQNMRTVAKTSGWIEGKSTDMSLPRHSAVGCSVPFSRLFPSVEWGVATKQGFFLHSSYKVDGKQYKSGFMILDCSKLPVTEMLESKCPD